jgi:hypothetical protein
MALILHAAMDGSELLPWVEADAEEKGRGRHLRRKRPTATVKAAEHPRFGTDMADPGRVLRRVEEIPSWRGDRTLRDSLEPTYKPAGPLRAGVGLRSKVSPPTPDTARS